MTKKNTSIRIDMDVYKDIVKKAQLADRNVSQQISHLARKDMESSK